MPHIILTGPVTPEDIWLAFAPSDIHADQLILKATECLLAHDRSLALVRAIVVERGFQRQFLVRIRQSAPRELTISLDPVGAPDASEGVKRFLALVATVIMRSEPSMILSRTDMPGYVEENGG